MEYPWKYIWAGQTGKVDIAPVCLEDWGGIRPAPPLEKLVDLFEDTVSGITVWTEDKLE